MQTTSRHGMWSSRLAFILAATGSAVGLGNIWRFPYITSEHGGGAFVLIYLACIALIGLPVMLSEIVIGRRGRVSPINALKKLSSDSGKSGVWASIGWIGIIAGFLILSFYSVVAGWTLHYAFLYAKQLLGGAAITDPAGTFSTLLSHPGELTMWHGVFMIMTVCVVGFGVEKGLERAVSILMPLLFVLLLILLGYSMTTGHFGDAAAFLFQPDFSKITAGAIVTAMGQAFFTLSLGMCAIMTYGAYLPSGVNIPRVGVTVAVADTTVAIVAGLAIFPVIISFGLDPAGGGPGLIFTSLPLAFNEMPFGIAYGLMFFLLLTVAAWTSAISLMEPATAYVVEQTDMSRRSASLIVAFVAWLLGLLSVFSFNVWQEVNIMGRSVQGAIEYVASDVMLPLGGLLTAIFAGWVLTRQVTREELDEKMPDWAYTAWSWLVKVITPLLIIIVLAGKIIEVTG